MTAPGFTADASLQKTNVGLTERSVFGFARRRGRRIQTFEHCASSSQVVPAHLPPGHIHGGCRCEVYGNNGECRLWLC
jgi:hypothetical protein